MRNKRQRRHFPVFNLLIIFLAVVLAVSIVFTVLMVREAGNDFYDRESSLYYSLNDHNYSTLARRYYENAAGREDDPRVKKLAEFYAVGRYFEQAFFANASIKAQDTERETRFRKQMEELEPQMGQFSAEKDRILEIFPACTNPKEGR